MRKILFFFVGVLILTALAYFIFSGALKQPAKEITNDHQENIVCTTDYSPVCGKDGKTYSNKCMAEASNAEIDYLGECEEAKECSQLWWYDKNNKECQQKEFCGSYMYFGLKTFEEKEECEKSLEEYLNTPYQTKEEKEEILKKIGPGEVDIDELIELINESIK